MLLFLAFAGILMTAIALIWNLKVSYDSQCGALGQIPVLGPPVIQLPLLTVMAISLIEKSSRTFVLTWWAYFDIWLACVVVFTSLTILAGKLGEYVSKRRSKHN